LPGFLSLSRSKFAFVIHLPEKSDGFAQTL
jgi:hypothetical protein